MAVQCRLCCHYFRQVNPMIIFNRDVLAKVKDLTGLSLREEKHLPRHICPSCLKDLNMSIKLRERIGRNHMKLMSRKGTESDSDLETQVTNGDSDGAFSCELDMSEIIENISKASESDAESQEFYTKLNMDNQNSTQDFIEFSLDISESPDLDYLHKLKNQGKESDQEDDDDRHETYEIQSTLDIDNQAWKPESPNLDHLRKYQANEIDQASEDNEAWFNENNPHFQIFFQDSYCKEAEECESRLSLDQNHMIQEIDSDQEYDDNADSPFFKRSKGPRQGYRNEVLLAAKESKILKYQYQKTKTFENDQFEDLKNFELSNLAQQGSQIPKKGNIPKVKTLVAAGNAILNAEIRDLKGKIHKTDVVAKKVKSSEEDENIPPDRKMRTRKTRSRECTECGKVLKSLNNLKLHMLRHTGKKDFICNLCGRRFVSIHLLKLHKRVRHLGEQPFKCRFCQKSFSTSTAKSRHEVMKHVRDGSYLCDECGSQFHTQTCLNNHKVLHDGKKPFYCDICHINFSRRKSMKRHFQSQAHQKKATTILDIELSLDLDEAQTAVSSILPDEQEFFN
ncbi:zinc finger protein 62 [Drosophila gunungcola]|uniref:zinc finger protein 62 n=1 Tax=Drosophila gunungcola TaxID=103775 RepID=UPI0022E2971F|nr:zinc finger protein 62 [Drosophila gunungcola]